MAAPAPKSRHRRDTYELYVRESLPWGKVQLVKQVRTN